MVNIVGNHDGSSAVDYTVNPATGFAWATGPRNLAVPFNHLLPAWDAITGALAARACSRPSAAALARAPGSTCAIALSDVAFWMVGNLGKIAEVQINHHERVKDGNYLYGAFGRDFLTKDGHRVMIVALTLRQWRSLVEATGTRRGVRRDRAADGRRPRRRGRSLRGARGARRHAEAVGARAHARRGRARRSTATASPGARTRRSSELVEHDPRCSTENPMFAEVEQPGIGTYLMPGSPLAFSGAERLPARPRRCWASTPTRCWPRCSASATARSARCTSAASWPGRRRRRAGRRQRGDSSAKTWPAKARFGTSSRDRGLWKRRRGSVGEPPRHVARLPSSHAGPSPTGDERHSEKPVRPNGRQRESSQLAAGLTLRQPDVTGPIQTAGTGPPRKLDRHPRRRAGNARLRQGATRVVSRGRHGTGRGPGRTERCFHAAAKPTAAPIGPRRTILGRDSGSRSRGQAVILADVDETTAWDEVQASGLRTGSAHGGAKRA